MRKLHYFLLGSFLLCFFLCFFLCFCVVFFLLVFFHLFVFVGFFFLFYSDLYYGKVTLSFTWPTRQNQSQACTLSDNVQLSARMTSSLWVRYENSNAEISVLSFGNSAEFMLSPTLTHILLPCIPHFSRAFPPSFPWRGGAWVKAMKRKDASHSWHSSLQ